MCNVDLGMLHINNNSALRDSKICINVNDVDNYASDYSYQNVKLRT